METVGLMFAESTCKWAGEDDGELCHIFRTLHKLKKLWAIKMFLHWCQDFPRLLLFEKVFLKGGSSLCVDALFSQHLDRAASLFWHSGKSDVADLEQKEQSLKNKARNKPQMNQLQEWTHLLCHIISLHLTLLRSTSQHCCLQVESMHCDSHQDLFYLRVQDLFLDFPRLNNWTFQKLLWKLSIKITNRLKNSSHLSRFSILSFSFTKFFQLLGP